MRRSPELTSAVSPLFSLERTEPLNLLYIKETNDGYSSPSISRLERLGQDTFIVHTLDDNDLKDNLSILSTREWAHIDVIYVSNAGRGVFGYGRAVGDFCAAMCDIGTTIVTDFWSSYTDSTGCLRGRFVDEQYFPFLNSNSYMKDEASDVQIIVMDEFECHWRDAYSQRVMWQNARDTVLHGVHEIEIVNPGDIWDQRMIWTSPKRRTSHQCATYDDVANEYVWIGNEIVRYTDETPLIGVRMNKGGLVVTLNCYFGDHWGCIGGDGFQLLLNCLCLKRKVPDITPFVLASKSAPEQSSSKSKTPRVKIIRRTPVSSTENTPRSAQNIASLSEPLSFPGVFDLVAHSDAIDETKTEDFMGNDFFKDENYFVERPILNESCEGKRTSVVDLLGEVESLRQEVERLRSSSLTTSTSLSPVSEFAHLERWQRLLEENNFGKFIRAFERDGWDDESVWKEMKDEDLFAMGFKRGHVVRFKKLVERVSSG